MPTVSSVSPLSFSRGKKRTSAACDFCRRRKLGCDNSKPKCENCKVRGVNCTYAERVKSARPSNARMMKVMEENSRLRDLLGTQTSQTEQIPKENSSFQGSIPSNHLSLVAKTSASNPGRDPAGSESTLQPAPDISSTTLLKSPYTSSVDVQVHFHGPSSVLFDEGASAKRHSSDSSFGTSFQVKNQLLAGTTRQRQMEVINLKLGKLDFGHTDPKQGTRLLSIFWNRQHYSGTIVYRPVFMRDMACQGPYFSKLLLNAILFAASKYTTDTNDDEETGRQFRRLFEEQLHSSGSAALLRSRITTIQALLIVADALFSWCDERSLSWHYMGIAINMIVDLGIHVDCSKTRPAEEGYLLEDMEVRRRLFWAAFVLDKVQSIYQGRPPRLREMDNRVPIQFLDDYEELEQFNTLTYSVEAIHLDCPSYNVSAFEQLCKLSIIMDQILCSLYSEKSSACDPVELLDKSRKFHCELQRWRNMLPPHLQIQLDDHGTGTILPHTLSLLSMYNSLVILLHRPFVSDGHLQSVSESAASSAFATCATAAFEIHQILQLYKQRFCMTTVPYFVSYATYVSATIHVRIAAQSRASSNAHRYLRNCLDVLAEHRIRCHAPRRTMSILLGLMYRLKVDVGKLPNMNYSHCSRVDTPGRESIHVEPRDDALPLQAESGTELGLDEPFNRELGMGLDPMFTDLDMDEIMRSFVLVPKETTRPANSQHGTEPSNPIMPEEPNDNMNSFRSPKLSANSSNEIGGFVQGSDLPLFLDPLFGIDVSFG